MSVAFYGDYDTTETVVIPFNTFSSDDPSASVTITNLAAADVEIHKDGSTTQRASDNGVTVSIDFDSVTGNHIVSIDLSDNSDAGFYANGSRYQVRMEGTTVDGATINAWIGAFSIGCTLRPTTAGRTLDIETGGCAGIDWANVANPTTAVDLSATDIQLCDTVTTLTGHTAQTGDGYAVVAHADYGNAKLVRSTTPANALDVSATGEAGLDFANIKDATGAHTLTNITVPTVTTLTGHTAQTGDTYAALPTNFSDLSITATTGRVDIASIEGSDATDQINAAMDAALDTAIPGSPTANSINERIATLDDNYTAARAGYIDNINGHTAQTGDTYGALPSNFSDLAITASTGKVTVGTNDDKTGYSISGTKTTLDALNDITVADIIAGVADGSYDLQEMMCIIFAACAGKSTGGGTTTLKFRDSADSKNRISATVDSTGNRTAVTLDAS